MNAQSKNATDKQVVQQATDMVARISTDWKMDVAGKQLLAIDPADNEQGVIATFNGPNHMDITFAMLAPVTIKTLLDLHIRGIAKVKEQQAEISRLRDLKSQPDKDYTTQIAMMFGEQNFREFLINRYALDEKEIGKSAGTKKARAACEKAFKKEFEVKSTIEIKFSQKCTDHWLNINREFQKSDFAKQPEAKENAA